MIDIGGDVEAFHNEEVMLLKAQQDEMRVRRDAGRSRLATGLKENGHPPPDEIASQGSYAMRTMVQDPENDYDIDDGIYFSKGNLTRAGFELSPLEARQRVCNALKHDERLSKEAEVKDNCVRQEYVAGYHIDMPVYRIVRSLSGLLGNVEYDYELASGNNWVRSDARAVTEWYKGAVGQLNAGEADGSQLRRITRLTKKFARSRPEWKERTTSGICITKLVVDCFSSQPDRDDTSLIYTWNGILTRLRTSVVITHPVLPGTFLAQTGDVEVGFLRDCLAWAMGQLNVLTDPGCTRANALAVLDNVFGTDFFSKRPAKGLLRPAAAAAATGLTFPAKAITPNKPAGFA